MILKTIKSGKGFTLVELILVIFIITESILFVYLLTAKGFTISTMVKNDLLATALAQEGIEIVKNIRDSNWLTEIDWKTNLNNGGWEITYESTSLLNPYDDSHFLYVSNIAPYFYSYSTVGTTRTPFKREIVVEQTATILDGNATEYLKIQSIVYWEERGQEKSLTLEEHLFDWFIK